MGWLKIQMTFIKPFETPQRSAKTKNFSLRPGLGREGLTFLT